MRIHGSCVAMMAVLLVGLAGCAYPERNQPLPPDAKIDDFRGYRGQQVYEPPFADMHVVMTISGGGTRASALGYGAMKAMKDVRFAPGGPTLLDAVDIVSSVSGGSVPAAYLALNGPEKLDGFREAFLLQDGMAALMRRGLTPWGLARLSTPAVERIDLLIDYLDDTIFRGATYADLHRPDDPTRWRRPYTILNAADMAAEAPFPFHQWRFDLLCSDLERLPLSVAVAASAAFPLALSPVTLRNFSEPGGCPAQKNRVRGSWPPFWIATRTSIYDNPVRVRRARLGAGYLATEGGKPEREFIHLLDGGIADNLGLAEPLRLLGAADIEPQLLRDFFRPSGAVRDLLVVVVNARSDPDSDLDREIATPGIVDMLSATTSSSIDNATFGTLGALEKHIADLIAVEAEARRYSPADIARLRQSLNIAAVQVDFDYIADGDCRDRFKNVATTWALDEKEVDALTAIAGALLWKSPGFRGFLDNQKKAGRFTGKSWTEEQAGSAEAKACRLLEEYERGS